MRILLAEDEPRIATDVAGSLAAAGYLVDHESDGETIWFRGGTENYDLIVLDLGLPRLDGLTILKRWRAEGRTTPILILTARSAWVERVEGIDAGADDYLVKPFRMEELVARVRALIRRSVGQTMDIVQAGPLSLDTRQMRLAVAGVPKVLTPLEYRLMAYLMLNKGRVVSATELLEHLHGDDDSREANALEAVITRLRRKLGTHSIETRRGFGYLVSDNVGQ